MSAICMESSSCVLHPAFSSTLREAVIQFCFCSIGVTNSATSLYYVARYPTHSSRLDLGLVCHEEEYFLGVVRDNFHFERVAWFYKWVNEGRTYQYEYRQLVHRAKKWNCAITLYVDGGWRLRTSLIWCRMRFPSTSCRQPVVTNRLGTKTLILI